MPIYAYKCESCGFAKDVLQKFSDQPLSECPSCGAASAFRKQLTAAGFQLKGSGWYATDFKGGGNGADKGDKADKSDKSDKSDKKGDTAPAKAEGDSGPKSDKVESKTKAAEPSAGKKSETAPPSGSGS